MLESQTASGNAIDENTKKSFANLIALEEEEQKKEAEWMKTDEYHLFKHGAVAPEGGHCYLCPKGWDKV